jgi:phosphopantothenoylcysteine synthetase/decarboxylase
MTACTWFLFVSLLWAIWWAVTNVNANLKGRTILLGVTGSIAAYKAADLVGRLSEAGAEVFPILTAGAKNFIQPLTLQTLSKHPVVSDIWEEGQGWQPGHIELADRADLLLVAPATAHCLAQFAYGLAPDLLTSVHLATPAPVMLAPAMNGKMLQHPATQVNLRCLRERGYHFIEPDTGMLACGYEGPGKLASVAAILEAVADFFEER